MSRMPMMGMGMGGRGMPTGMGPGNMLSQMGTQPPMPDDVEDMEKKLKKKKRRKKVAKKKKA